MKEEPESIKLGIGIAKTASGKYGFFFAFPRWLLYGILLCIALGVVTIYYGRHGAKALECNTINVSEEVLPGMAGLRIAQITDIHCDTGLLEQSIPLILAAKPDLLVITGDFVDASIRLKRTRYYIALLKELSNVIPTYACLGNHDMEKLPEVERLLQRSNITLLRNQQITFHSKRLNRDMIIVGLGVWTEDDFLPEQCLQPRVNGKNTTILPVLVLNHDPKSREEMRPWSWNLMLTGDLHGLQHHNPFTGKPLINLSGDPYTEGYLPFGDQSAIFLSRGLFSAKEMRFYCPPEVNLINIMSITPKDK